METLNCSICFLKYDNNQREAVVLPCGHTFCSDCTTSSQNKCAVCREDFTNAQVKKNYIVRSILDEVNSKMKTQEKCATHKREIDRFCKLCIKLMCSVCQCSHSRNENDIISDMNLREEVEKIAKTYKDVGKAKQDLVQRKKEYIQKKSRDIEKGKASDANKVMESAQAEIQKVEIDKKANIKQAEEEAKRKIKEIELQRNTLIKKAEEAARKKIEEIDFKTSSLLGELDSQFEKLIEAIKKDCDSLTRQIETLQDLSKCKSLTLEECLAIYKTERLQRDQLKEFLKTSKSGIDSVSVPKKSEKEKTFEIGEIVDCYNSSRGDWVSAPVEDIQNNKVAVRGLNGWFDIGNPWLLQKWIKGSELNVGNRILLRVSDRSVQARVVEVKGNEINVSYWHSLYEKKSEWVHRNSDRIDEFKV